MNYQPSILIEFGQHLKIKMQLKEKQLLSKLFAATTIYL